MMKKRPEHIVMNMTEKERSLQSSFDDGSKEFYDVELHKMPMISWDGVKHVWPGNKGDYYHLRGSRQKPEFTHVFRHCLEAVKLSILLYIFPLFDIYF